jgi:hypothetical protein
MALAGRQRAGLAGGRVLAWCVASGGYRPRVVLLVGFAERADVLVVALGECGAPGFPQAGDDRDRGAAQAAPGQFAGLAVLQQAEKADLLPAGSCQPDLVPAAHRPVHRFPLASSGEPGRRRGRPARRAHAARVRCGSVTRSA